MADLPKVIAHFGLVAQDDDAARREAQEIFDRIFTLTTTHKNISFIYFTEMVQQYVGSIKIPNFRFRREMMR